MINHNASKPSMIVLMPMVWGLRNVIHSGVLERLGTAGVDVYLFMRQYDPSLLAEPAYADFSLAADCRSLLLPTVKQRVKGIAFLRDIMRDAFYRRSGIEGHAVYRRWHEREYSPAQRRKAKVTRLLGKWAQPTPIFLDLYERYDRLYKQKYDLEPIRDQLRSVKPDLIWSTVNIEKSFERAYVLAARELGIPIVNSILSFDNLTRKPALLVYDHYLVWNQKMRHQLLRFYPQVSSSQVTVTGTPQFDFHRRPEFLWSRQETLARLGLPANADYFLYATITRSLAPAEPDLVAGLAQRMRADERLKEQWLVARVHPLDDWSRWSAISDSSQRVLLSYAWDTIPDDERWALPTAADQARFVSSVAYANACLNIASTMTLDAAVLDRPVIGIRFDRENDAPQEIIYGAYDAEHYRPLVDSGGLRLAHNWQELMALMRQAIEVPEQDRENRIRMVTQECGVVDGRSAERVADALLDCLAEFRKGKPYKIHI
jgi:hypothetical protein